MQKPAAWLLGTVLILCVGGCATFGRRGPSSERVAACRELTREGVSAMESGEWQQAETFLRKALAASPEDPEALRCMAEALWRRGASEEATAHMESAARARPTDARLAARAGEFRLAGGDRTAALAHAEQAVRLDPQLAAAWALRGRVFWQRNEPERALADLNRALEFDPASPDMLWDVAVLYRQRGQPARCLATLHQFYDTHAAGQEPQIALLLEGHTLLELGRPQQAVDCFLMASERGPRSVDVLYSLAHAQCSAGRFQEATEAAQQALAVDASHEASRQLLAHLAAVSARDEPQRR